MRYEIVFICLCLLFIPSVQAANYTIGPECNKTCKSIGDIICCGACPVNETCPVCEECGGDCMIDERISPGETYENDEGSCDIEIECKTCEETELEIRDYHMEILIHKLHEDDSLNFCIEIRDFTSALVDTKHHEFYPEDIVSIRYKYDFECPTKVYFENINFATCSHFFDDYMNESEPLMFQLASGTSECMQNLISCQGNRSSDRDLMNHYKDLYTDMQTNNNALTEDMREMNTTTYDKQMKVEGRVTEARKGFVPDAWMWAAIIGWIIAGGIIIGHFYGGDW